MTVESVIDWRAHKTVVFESDDWGTCAMCPDAETAERIARHPRVQQVVKARGKWVALESTLESGADLRALFEVLERHRGGDGRHAVFTAFYATANPDYDAIRGSGFTQYHDIAIDRGWSQGWHGDGALPTAHEGIRRNVWYPEWHARLHHSSPHLWLEILRGGHEDTEVYRMLFDHGIFAFDCHLPEYERMAIREQFEWVKVGVETFRRTFGFSANCAVNSDAIPGTEESWALCGLRVRSLRSAVTNNGRQIRPYGNLKPDGTMDGTNPMGRYNRFLDMVYLNRNAFFEVAGGHNVLDETYKAVLGCWQRGEPAVVSTHRVGYCSLHPAHVRHGLDQLDALLTRLDADHPDAAYMTSWEVAQLCRAGVSAIRFGDKWVLRNYGTSDARITTSAKLLAPAVCLKSGRAFPPLDQEPGAYVLPPGVYQVSGCCSGLPSQSLG